MIFSSYNKPFSFFRVLVIVRGKMSSESETQLVARARKGDSDAWNHLFDLHYAPTARFIFQLSPDFSQEDAEEICQDAFLSVVRHLSSFNGQSKLQTWIFRIAANKARDFRERRQAVKRGGRANTVSLQAEDPATGQTINPPSNLPGPDVLLANAERVTQIGQALIQLGEPCREIIELRYFGDLSYDEISRELKLNEKTVSSRLSKCLDRLEKIVAQIFSGKKPSSVPV